METAAIQKEKKHDLDIDIMRIVATFFVVMIHSSDINYFSGIFYNSISRFSVPVFVLISGSYMLSYKPDNRYLAKKSSKLFLIMIIWSGIYYIYNLLCGTLSYNGIAGLLTYLMTEPIHLWYIYATIALYIFTPVFYVFCKNATRREYLYAIFLTFLLGSIVVIALRSGQFPVLSIIVDKMKVAYTLGFVFLYLLGGYLQKYEIQKKLYKRIYTLGVIGTIATVIGTRMLSRSSISNDLLLSFFAPNVLMASIGFYLFVKRFYLLHPINNDKVHSILHNIANCTMGVYLLHPLIIMILQKSSLFFSNWQYIMIPVRTSVVFVLSTVVVFILKKIPVLKWFL